MIYWGIMLFALGMLALADFTVTGGEIFGSINSIIFLALSFAVLIRVRNKQREGQIERLKSENQEYRRILGQPESSQENKPKAQEAMF